LITCACSATGLPSGRSNVQLALRSTRLTEALRELEELGIVTRHSRASVPLHVEYELTSRPICARRGV